MASCYPAKFQEGIKPNEDPTEQLADDMAAVVAASDMLYVISNVITWNMVCEANASDATLSLLMENLQGGFPNQGSSDHSSAMQIAYVVWTV